MTFDEIVALFKSLPADTYRAGDADFDARRARFYASCANVFGFEGWMRKPGPYKPPAGTAGQEGRVTEEARFIDEGRLKTRNLAASALGWLIDKNKLISPIEGTRNERMMNIAASEGARRIDTANKLERLFEGATLTSMKSPDLEATPGGGFGPRHVSASKVVKMMQVQDLRRDMPPTCMALLEAIITRNEYPWAGKGKAEEKRILQDIRLALDFADWAIVKADSGVAAALRVERELCQRWPAAEDWFFRRRLGPAVHSGRVIR